MKRELPVSLTKEQVENSPDVDSRNFSRQHERSYYDYYGWPYYWVGGDVWGGATSPASLAAEQRMEMAAQEQQSDDETHLRSAKEVMDYYIEATDGDIGHVEDFVRRRRYLGNSIHGRRYEKLVAGKESLGGTGMDRTSQLE